MNKQDDSEPILALMDEFLERIQAGEKPTIPEYCDAHPDLAEEIEELFPALVAMEDLQEEDPEAGGQDTPQIDERLPSSIGDYEIIAEIGRGGMGVVYEAEQKSLGRRVALKVLPENCMTSESARSRFRLEARAAARMHHSNIVPVFEVGEEEGKFFYAMQLIQGQSLDHVINELCNTEGASTMLSAATLAPQSLPTRSSVDQINEVPLDALSGSAQWRVADSNSSSNGSSRNQFYQMAARIGLQSAEGLSYAHDRGVVHRDIKPANLLLDRDGVVWITDFGLAKTDDGDGLTQTGDYLGTMRYMAPERFRNMCDERADVYSLGVTLYELLLQRPIHEATDRLKLMYRITEVSPEKPRSVAQDIPRDLETIVLKAIEREPETRYQTAKEFSEDLQRFLNDQPILARRVSASEQLIRWSRRNSGLAAALASIMALLVLLSVGGLWMGITQRNLREQADQATVVADNRRKEALAARDDSKAAEEKAQAAQRETEQALVAIGEARKQETLALTELERQRKQNARNSYFTQMRRISELIDLPGSTRAIRRIVDGWENDVEFEELKNWEWGFAQAASRPDGLQLAAPRPSWSVAWSPSGETVAVGNDQGTQFFDSVTGELLPFSLDDSEGTFWIRYQPSGTLIATTGKDGTLKLWNASSGSLVKQFGPYGPSDRCTCVWSLTGRKLACFVEGTGILILNVDNLEADPITIHCPNENWRYLSFSPDETRIAAGIWYNNRLAIYNIESGELEKRFPDETGRPSATALIWNGDHDLKNILHATPSGRIDLYDGTTWERLRSFHGHSQWASVLNLGSDENRILSGSFDRSVRVWDMEQGRFLRTFNEHREEIEDARFSPDGKRVASVSAAGVWIWELERDFRLQLNTTSAAEKQTGIRQHTVSSLAWHPDNNLLATTRFDFQCRIWDVAQRKVLREIEGLGHHASWHPNGKWLAFAIQGRNGVLLNIETGEESPILNDLRNLKWNNDGSLLATRGPGATGVVTVYRFDADSKQAKDLSKSDSRLEKLYKVENSDEKFCWSPSGNHLGVFNTQYHLQVFLNGELVQQFEDGFESRILAAEWSPDGRFIAAGGEDETIRVFDLDTNQQHLLTGHNNPVLALDWNAEGNRLASASVDGTVRIWESGDWQESFVQKTDSSGITALDWSDDGKQIAVGDNAGTIVIFRTQPLAVESNTQVAVAPPRTEPTIPQLSAFEKLLTSKNGKWIKERLPEGINTEFNEYEPVVSSDELTLLFTSDRPGGLGSYDIYMSSRKSKTDEWSTPVLVDVSSEHDDQAPHLSADGLSLYFQSSRSGLPQIYVANRETLDADWSVPELLPEPINSNYITGEPSLSTDGLTLVFLSSKPPRNGIFDLWMSSRASIDDPWSEPIHLGKQGLNSEQWQGSPSIFGDGFGSTLVYHASSGARIASRERHGDPFVLSQPLDPDGNLEGIYTPFVTENGKSLYYRRTDVLVETSDIWLARRVETEEVDGEDAVEKSSEP